MIYEKKPFPFYKCAVLWLALFTIFCFLNSIFIYALKWYGQKDGGDLAFTIPFFHCFFIVAAIVLHGIFRGSSSLSSDEDYIKANHPQIAQQLYPYPIRKKTFTPASRLWFSYALLYFAFLWANSHFDWFKIPFWLKGISFLLLPILATAITIKLHVAWLRLFKGDQVAKQFLEKIKPEFTPPPKTDAQQPQSPPGFFAPRSLRQSNKDFLKGRLDDGSDPHLKQIQIKTKTAGRLLAWIFILIPATWLFNGILILIFHSWSAK